MLFKNAPAILHHVVAVFSQIATSKLVIVRRVPRVRASLPTLLETDTGLDHRACRALRPQTQVATAYDRTRYRNRPGRLSS